MDILKYLSRISFTAEPSPNIATLNALHWLHVFHVPFEDIDIQLKTPVSLKTDDVFEKVITHRRGGYCYELNSLFYWLLVEIGFNASLISCRVSRGRSFSQEFDHMAILVAIDNNEYLADVGFGNFTLKPLLLQEGLIQDDGRDQFRIRQYGLLDNAMFYAAEKLKQPNQQFVPEYIFSRIPRTVGDFQQMNQWQQTHPDSHFVQNYICSRPTAQGRISVINNHLITTTPGAKKQQVITNMEREDLLRQHFGISLTIRAAT